jgi:hypothetical protein
MKSLSLKLGTIATIALATIAYFGYATQVFGAPSIFSQSARSQVATSTVGTQLTPGNATTTLVYDSWQREGTNQTDIGNTYGADEVTLLAQINASSTATKFKFVYEYSQDGIDWYTDNILETATTTAIQIGTVTKQYEWTFASSTIGGVAVTAGQRGYNGTLNRDSKAIRVPVPTRFVRVVVTVTGANGYFWGEFVPKKEVK